MRMVIDMNARDYLEQVAKLDILINTKLDQVYTLRCLAQKTTTVFSLTPKGGGFGASNIENRIVRILELEAELNVSIDRYVDLKRCVHSTLSHMWKMDHKLLLELRYINGLPWDTVAERMGISFQHAHKLHKVALNAFEKIL